jgi:3-oxoacyl-[acyl-carrier-protein] synthase-3
VPATDAYANYPQADVDRIIGNIGVHAKREAPITMTGSDLAIPAAKALLQAIDWAPDSVDLLFYITLGHDHIVPGTGGRVHAELGMRLGTMVFDVTHACAGFSHALILCDALMKGGLAKRILIVTTEASTHRTRQSTRDAKGLANLGNAMLFGDACCVTAVDDESDDIHARTWGTDGSGNSNIYLPAGGTRMPIRSASMFEYEQDAKGDFKPRPIDLQMNGAEVFTFTIRRVPPMFDEVMRQCQWPMDSVDGFVLHQANKFMLDFLRKRMKLPDDRTPFSIQEFGNTSSASLPITLLTQCADKLAKDYQRWILLGFGLGLAWSGVALETRKVVTVPLLEL